eukprot:TCONS_00012119-protein
MSHLCYNKQWGEAQSTLKDLLEIEVPDVPPKPEKDRIVAFQNLAVMYIKYIQIFTKLEQSFDQIVHPQKRLVLRHVLDGAMGRLLELKNNMVSLEFAEYHYFDDVLSDLKLTPNDIEIPVPKYFLQENREALKERDKLMSNVLKKTRPYDFVKTTKDEITMTKEEAIQLIQIHERARQGRWRAKFMKEIRVQEERERLAATRGAPTLDRNVAATKIQKIWKGFMARKKTKVMREEELIFVGMKPAPPVNYKDTPMYKADQQMEKRRIIQQENEREYQKALVTIKEKLREVEGPEMRERLQDQIRQWFIECRDATGKFPEYPAEDEGGSSAIFTPKDPAEVEAELKAKEEEKAKGKKGKGKDGKGKDKKDKKGKGKDKDKKGKKGKGDEEEDVGIVFDPSAFVPTLSESSKMYRGVWENRDESLNFSQKHDVELIKEEKRVEIETEVRLHVDELMRQELKNLKMAVDRDKGKKGKKGGKKSGKKKKGKKSGKKGGKKGKKGKKEKDLTADRTIESLYEELVKEGILVQYPKTPLKDYLGEYSYLGTTLRQANIEPMPSLSDVRRVITEYCILPLGSQIVHEKAPLVKSCLITGPRGCGKKMLVHAICTETGANLFDLTAANVVGKYPGKAGLAMMLHMVFKVARQLAPSVVYVGDCEKTFQKKLPKTDKTDPKRFKKDFPKIVKGMKAEDRVLLLGTSLFPFSAEVKPFCQTFQKLLLLPRPDYASRFLLWPSLIKKHGGIVTDALDISSLSKVTDGYTPGHMVDVIKQVLTDRRIKQQLTKKPLVASEFVGPLAKIEPIYKEEEEAFKVWYAKTPLGKKRAKAAKEGEEDGGGKGGKGKDKGKGKGKKKK